MTPQTLSNMNLFVDGVSFNGDVPTLTLPKLSVKTEEYRAGGMSAPIELDMGLEKLEANFTTNGVRRESLKFFGLVDQAAFTGTFRGSFKGHRGVITPVVATLRGMLKEVDGGEWKPASVAEFKHAIAVTYYKLEVDGNLIYEVDPINNVRVIDGVDQLAAERAALGL
ncbi:phage major tail tube protein [Pseudomonas syringae]|nr:phage major tail tube protein [Pseudomonas syringae]MBD8802306.1 phage major tail tube protein [Pseudomonas syringae]MBD8812869.1 phage major tail tube protein [Pseudomonas syringae]